VFAATIHTMEAAHRGPTSKRPSPGYEECNRSCTDGAVADHGSQYTALAFGKRCRQAGVRPSMGSVGDCYDNALCESYFATLERELLDRHRFATHGEARLAVFEYLEAWYNPHRRHSALGQRSPVNYERYHLSRVLKPKRKTVREIGVTSMSQDSGAGITALLSFSYQ